MASDSDHPARGDPYHASNSVLYAIVIMLMVLIGIAGSVGIVLIRPTQDNTQLIVTILGFTTAAATSLLGFLKSEQNGSAIRGVHGELNSRLTQWMAEQKENAAIAARAAYSSGRDDQRAETAAAIAVAERRADATTAATTAATIAAAAAVAEQLKGKNGG